MECQASLTRKAWNNPLAPLAKCTREATAVVACDTSGQHTECVCALHLRKRLKRGWTLVRALPKPAAPTDESEGSDG